MEVYSHGLDTLGLTKESDKAYNPELEDIMAPPSSQVSTRENFAVNSLVDTAGVHFNDESQETFGVNPTITSKAEFSFPPATSDFNIPPDITFQAFDLTETVQDPQHEINQVHEQHDEEFDDMVVLENDVVTSATRVGGADGLQVTDIQLGEFCKAPASDTYNALPVAADGVVMEENVEGTSDPSGALFAEATVTLTSDVSAVTTVVNLDIPVRQQVDVAITEVANDLPMSVENKLPSALMSKVMEEKALDATEYTEMANAAADGDTSEKSEPIGGTLEISDEDILAIKGQKVLKKFGRKYFAGEIVDFDPETKWFKVVYEDGDDEDLELSEVKELLASAKKKRPHGEGNEEDESSVKTKKQWKSSLASTGKTSSDRSDDGAFKSPKTLGSKAKASKSSRKYKASKKAKSPGKLIKKALNSPAFKTPANFELKGEKHKGRLKTVTPKGSKGGSSKKKNLKAFKNLNWDSPKSQTRVEGKASAESSTPKSQTKVKGKESAESSTPKSQARVKGKARAESSKSKVAKSAGFKRKLSKGETSTGKRSKRDTGVNTDLVGKQIRKEFDGSLYDGVVVKFDNASQFYKVKYADGDQEDLELHELEPILVQNLSNVNDKDDKPAKLSLMSAGRVSRSGKGK